MDAEIIIFCITITVMGVICHQIAASKNRSRTGWYFAGALFGIFAILVIAFLPSIEKDKDDKANNLEVYEGE